MRCFRQAEGAAARAGGEAPARGELAIAAEVAAGTGTTRTAVQTPVRKRVESGNGRREARLAPPPPSLLCPLLLFPSAQYSPLNPFPTCCSPHFLSVCFNVLEINFRIYNEMTKIQDRVGRPRTVSSPIPVSPGGSRPLSPSTQTKIHYFPSLCFIVVLYVTTMIFCVNARFPPSRLGCRLQSNQSDALEFAIWSLCFLPVWHLSSRFAQLHARPCCRTHSSRKSRHWAATFRTRLLQPCKQLFF